MTGHSDFAVILDESGLPEQVADAFHRSVLPGTGQAYSDGRLGLALHGQGEIHVSDERVVALSGRLDELAGSWRAGVPGDMTAGEVVASAWRAKGSACLDSIAGDVVVIVWDREARELTIFRDLCGARPAVVAHASGRHLAAGDWFRLARFIGGSLRPDEHWVAHFALGFSCRTPHSPDRRISPIWPGRAARPSGTSWSFSPQAHWHVERISSREASPDRFRDLLDQSIADRTRGVERIGVSLSGGLDSTSVLASGAQLSGSAPEWVALAIPFTDPDGDERTRQQLVAESARARLAWVPLEGRGPFGGAEGFERMLERYGAPSTVPNWFMLDAVAARAEDERIPLMLGGEDPDSLLGGSGYSFLGDLLVTGRWTAWWREATALRALYDESYRSWLRASVRLAFPPRHPPSAHGWPTGVTQTVLNAQVLEQGRRSGDLADPWPHIPGRVGRRFAGARLAAGDPGHMHVVHDEASRAFRRRGIGIAQPFMERRLMEYAMGLPWDHVVQQGVAKQVLRQAMRGRLPDEVRLNTRKGVLSAPDRAAVTGWQLREVERGLDAAIRLPGWFNPDEIERVRATLRSGEDLLTAPRVARLALWIDYSA